MVFRFVVLLFVVFLLGLGIDYIFVILEKKNLLDVGSFLHILANGILIFVPLSAIRQSFYLCFPAVLISAFVVYAPIVIIKYNYVVFLSIAVYTIFAVYIACKKTRSVGER